MTGHSFLSTCIVGGTKLTWPATKIGVPDNKDCHPFQCWQRFVESVWGLPDLIFQHVTYIHTQSCMSTYMQVYLHSYNINVCACTFTYIHTYILGDMCMSKTDIQTLIFAYKHTSIHIYTDIHAWLFSYIHTYLHAHICASAHVCLTTHIHTCIHTYTYIYIHIHVCLPIYKDMYVYIQTYRLIDACACTYICIYTYIETHLCLIQICRLDTCLPVSICKCHTFQPRNIYNFIVMHLHYFHICKFPQFPYFYNVHTTGNMVNSSSLIDSYLLLFSM